MKYGYSLVLILFGLLCIGAVYYTLSYFGQSSPIGTPVKIIAQTGPIKEGLKTDCLSEMLGLSVDNPKCLSVAEVEKVLAKIPLIKKVSAAYLNPETLYIDYTLRNPVFAFIDLENTALDFEGNLFPLSPYFTPKNLPELYLGLKNPLPFGQPLKGREIALATEFYQFFQGAIKRIDLSHIDKQSLGKREIVVILEQPNKAQHMLRLSTTRYKEELLRYQSLKEVVQEGSFIVDLRVPQLAYITHLTQTECKGVTLTEIKSSF